MRHKESKLQQKCIKWFRLQYRELSPLLFAVPNGGKRTVMEAKILKEEGVTPGVSDLILLVSRHGYNALCIEMKTPEGRQTITQQQWQRKAETHGNKYLVIRSFEQFVHAVNTYLRP